MQSRKPMILVLAGPNGSGKSTITAFFDKVGKYTNADDVVATTGMNNMEAAVLVDRMRYESIAKTEDFKRVKPSAVPLLFIHPGNALRGY